MSKLFLALFLALTPTAFGSIWYVDGVNGNDSNDCKTRLTACKTIGHAISLASSGDTIGVGPATYTENLTIGVSLKLIGSGAATTIIDGGMVDSVVTITIGTVTLSRVTIRNGRAKHGGGINNAGNLTVSRSTIAGNRTTNGPGTSGGGIYSTGMLLTVINSTIADNFSDGGAGGGIQNFGTAIIDNSTVSGNRALSGGNGGGIFNEAILTINNSTISGNSGGIQGAATLQNSIVADSTSAINCAGTMTSLGYNLSSDATCNFNGPGDLNNTDPKLGQLQNNGGQTQTQALLSGSPAIDAGNPNGCTDGAGHLLTTDQRGAPRPDKEDSGGCDMGAFERQSD